MSNTAVLTIPEKIKHEPVTVFYANKTTVKMTMDGLFEVARCISECGLTSHDAVDYVNEYAQEFIVAPL
jgi:predicted metal-dependent TIM-barrel fold hydrolase